MSGPLGKSKALFVIMGVSGSGKSTIGSLLAQRLGVDFLDADDYHPQSNKDKMHAGHPLTDEDRWPWIVTLNKLLREHVAGGAGCVLACSALKATYRERLQEEIPLGALDFVLLKGSPELIAKRLAARRHQFMNPKLLESQLATLEAPENSVTVSIDQTPEQVVDEIVKKSKLA